MELRMLTRQARADTAYFIFDMLPTNVPMGRGGNSIIDGLPINVPMGRRGKSLLSGYAQTSLWDVGNIHYCGVLPINVPMGRRGKSNVDGVSSTASIRCQGIFPCPIGTIMGSTKSQKGHSSRRDDCAIVRHVGHFCTCKSIGHQGTFPCPIGTIMGSTKSQKGHSSRRDDCAAHPSFGNLSAEPAVVKFSNFRVYVTHNS
jgi:hypothetical protein